MPSTPELAALYALRAMATQSREIFSLNFFTGVSYEIAAVSFKSGNFLRAMP